MFVGFQPSPKLKLNPLNGLLFGGDYNPDQWPEIVWEEDIKLMKESGVNLVTLPVFGWASLEPKPFQYDFSELDKMMNIMANASIKVDLATATASPPAWMAKLDPQSLPITKTGEILYPGSRQHYCPHNPTYQKHAFSLVRQLANR